MSKIPSLWVVAIVFFLAVPNSFGQTIPYPKSQHQDSIFVVRSLPELAKKTIPLYQEVNKGTYNDNYSHQTTRNI
jgi:hypothetical protein